MERVLNPVFREGVKVYLIEGHGFIAYFFYLIFLTPLQLLFLFLPSFDPPAWSGPANLFKVSAIAALVLMVYFLLRVTNQEFVSWRFLPLRHWIQREGITLPEVAGAQIALLGLYSLIFVLLSLPLLGWAAAIARVSLGLLLSTLLLFFFYGLAYGIWGLVAIAWWEHRVEMRQVFLRCLLIFLVFLSALVYLPLNPIAFLLSFLGEREMGPMVVWGWRWKAATIHFLFHSLLLGSGLLLYGWALKKENYL